MVDRTPNYQLILTDFNKRGWQNEFYENMRIIDGALSRIVGIANFQGQWANSTAYTVGMLVIDETSAVIYQCAVPHTSANTPTTFATDRTNNPTYWVIWNIPARSRGAWATGIAYAVGDFVSNAATNQYLVCLIGHTSGVLATDITAGRWDALLTVTGSVLSDDTPQTISDTTADAGNTTTTSRSNHVHPHGTRGGGTLHANAVSGGTAGFMTGADKLALDTVVANSLESGDPAGGDLTGTYPNPGIANNVVDNSKVTDMVQATIKGRAAGAGTGDPTDLTDIQVAAIIPAATETQVGVLEIATQAEADAGTDDARIMTSAKTKNALGNLVNALTEDTTPDRILDFLLTYDASAGVGKKITLANLLKQATLLATLTAGGNAQLDFTATDNTRFGAYLFVFTKILPATNAQSLWMRHSNDGGSSFVSTTTYTHITGGFTISSTFSGGSTGDTKNILAGDLSSTGNNDLSGFLIQGVGASFKRHTAMFGYTSSASGELIAFAIGSSQTSPNAFRFLMSSGNIASGTIECYGLSKV